MVTIRNFFSLLSLLLLVVTPSYSQTSTTICSTVVSINSLDGVLYKPENLHGARGPTFLVQNPAERTNKKRLQVRDTNCKLISTFGLFRTDFPYGARYYQKSGGSNHNARKLRQLAKKSGTGGILIEGLKKWILVKDPTKREGVIYG